MSDLTNVLKQLQDDLKALKIRVDKIEPREIDATSKENILDGLDFVTDAGTANPSGGAINVLGGLGINTVGAGDDLTINADGLVLYDHDYDTEAGLWTIAAAGGVWETDPTLLTNFIVPAGLTATVYCVGRARWNSNVVRTTSMNFCCYLDGATQGGNTGYMGQPIVSHWLDVVIVARYLAIAAGAHTVTFQAVRLNAGDTVSLQQRSLWVVVVQA